MSNIGPAPIMNPLSNGRIWSQWFSTLGDSLKGRWGQQKRQLEKLNIDPQPTTEYLNYKGTEISFLFVWESGVTFNGSEILLSDTPATADLTMRSGILQVWDGSTLVGGAYCSERTIELPNLSSSGRTIVQGSIMTKITDPRRIV